MLPTAETRSGVSYQYIKTNDFSTPTFLMKNGLALEKSNDYSGALKVYEQIEQEYPASPEGRDIEKYIERAQLKLKK